MRKLVSRIRSLVDWAGRIYQLIGWLGWAAAITGPVAAVGWSVWAIIMGVPAPIAFMAGYCTFVAVVVLTLSPLAYRALSRIATFPVSHEVQRPNAAVWQYVPKFALYQAACLLADEIPAGGGSELKGDAFAWWLTLHHEIQSRQIIVAQFDEISREELRRFAERHGIRRRFLFPD